MRRLAFVAHAGASAALTPLQTCSRLEHSLGLLALVAHFDADDVTTRAAALLHDVGNLPMSHTFEDVAGLEHHDLGAARILESEPLLVRHGIVAAHVLARKHFSQAKVVPDGVVRHVVGVLLEKASQGTRDANAAMTDDEFWVMLVSDPRTTELATTFEVRRRSTSDDCRGLG